MKTIIYYLSSDLKDKQSNLLKYYSKLQKLIMKTGLNDRIKFSLTPIEDIAALNQGHGSLTYFINHYSGDLSSLCVLLDLQKEQVQNANEIAKLVVCYPEISFYFLNSTSINHFVETLSKNFKLHIDDNEIYKETLVVTIDKCLEKIYFDCQLFDGSNIRSVLCQAFHKKWHFSDNFHKLKESRREHYAICVDSDLQQCQLSAYSIYSCGYRCSTISSAGELTILKEIEPRPDLIIRDFDLQLQDLPSDDINNPPLPVHQIRGFQDVKDPNGDIDKWVADLYNENNPYWKKEDKDRMYHLSYKYDKINLGDAPQAFNPDCSILQLRGWSKPLAGLYYPFFKHIGETKERYRESHPKNSYNKTTLRGDGNHIPVKIYDDAADMVRRAENYYKNSNYIVAAIVAQSAVEYLNRFYRALSLKAYSIQALAENAIAMSVQGGNEQDLSKDAQIRVNEITRMVEYLYDNDENICNTNTLNQIFSDCRLFCKEKEHFESEDVFLSAVAELNEGASFKLSNKRCNKDDKKKGLLKKHINYFSEQIGNFIEKVNSYGSEYGTTKRSENAREDEVEK